MVHLHWCYRFHVTTIAMLSGDGIEGVGCDVQEDEMNFYIHRNSRDWFGDVCVPVARDRCPRASDAQQLSDRRCMIRSRWECRVDFDDISCLDHLIAVSRVLLLWVAISTGGCNTLVKSFGRCSIV